MEPRDPIDVYKRSILNTTNNSIDLSSDELLQRTLKAASCIKLLHEQLPLLQTMTSREEIFDVLKQVKRFISGSAYEGHTRLLNSLWHKILFQPIEIKNKDSLVWQLMENKYIKCIYDGEKFLSRDLLISYLTIYPKLFCILVSESNTNGPCSLFCKINDTTYLVITFPMVAIRLFDNQEHAITVFLQSLLLDKSYNLTGYYSE